MKRIIFVFLLSAFCLAGFCQDASDTAALHRSLDKATAAIRAAFEKGDAKLVGQLHSPTVIKYFGGSNVMIGRDAVEKAARDWFANARVEFVENTIESTEFFGNIAIETLIFGIKTTPKNGGEPSTIRGRTMVIYMQDKSSPTGWLTIREIAQEAPLISRKDAK